VIERRSKAPPEPFYAAEGPLTSPAADERAI
jgi:hypothetical protein